MEVSLKYRASILKSYDETARLIPKMRTPVNADVEVQFDTIKVRNYIYIIYV